jgi:hypothetical protein
LNFILQKYFHSLPSFAPFFVVNLLALFSLINLCHGVGVGGVDGGCMLKVLFVISLRGGGIDSTTGEASIPLLDASDTILHAQYLPELEAVAIATHDGVLLTANVVNQQVWMHVCMYTYECYCATAMLYGI